MKNNLSGLGRLAAPDPRDQRFLLKRQPVAAGIPVHRYHLVLGGPLDQGGTSQCVAYSGVRYLTSHPVVNKGVEPYELYKACQQVDEWPGDDYDGTSVRALFKVLKSRGLIQEYRWAFEAETAIVHLLTTGPVVIGVNWYTEMFMPDKWNYIDPEGQVEGGHAVLVVGANRQRKNPDGTRGAVQILNSWGPKWGAKGRAWMSFNTFNRLIQEDGEACVATELKLAGNGT